MKCGKNSFKQVRMHDNFLKNALIVIMLNCSIVLQAQQEDFFIVNGTNIEIENFNLQITKMMDEVNVPGMSLAIIDKNQIVFTHTYGYKNIAKNQKVNKNTIFEAASLSKSFLVFVAHQLVLEGKLDLDKPIYQYLEYPPLKHDSTYKLITPRMILSHTSGIENWREYNNPDTLEILSFPGEKYIYSGEAYNYLAKVIEVILQKSYEDYISDRIIKPLKLKRTYLKYKPNSINPFYKGSPWNYAVGYGDFNNEFEKLKNLEPDPASAINLTAEDYGKLILSTFNSAHLPEAGVKNILQPTIQINKDDTLWHYGLGFEVLFRGNDTIIMHSGSNQGFKAWTFYSIKKDCGIVFLTNSDRGKLMAQRMNELTVDLDINQIFETFGYEQYPSNSIMLFNAYMKDGSSEMFKMIEELEEKQLLKLKTLNELGWMFYYHNDTDISEALFDKKRSIEQVKDSNLN